MLWEQKQTLIYSLAQDLGVDLSAEDWIEDVSLSARDSGFEVWILLEQHV